MSPAAAQPPALQVTATASPDPATARAAANIAALQRIKYSLRPLERKVDSSLVFALRASADPSLARTFPRLTSPTARRSDATVAVDIVAPVSSALLARLKSAGARIGHVSREVGSIRATVPYAAIMTIAASPEVRFIGKAHGAMTANVRPVLPATKAERAGLADALRRASASADETGAVVSEGDAAHGADLGFATAFESAAGFAENIRALRAAGCDILVDDVLYFAESSFQDGPIAQAVLDVIADGAHYFSSAGNEGNVLSGTSGSYEGRFVDSGYGVGKFAGDAHDFDPGPGVQIFQPVSYQAALFATPAILQWANPLGQASDDYDLYLFDSAGELLDFSQDVQDGTQDPLEILGVAGQDLGLAVVKFSGSSRYVQLSTLRGRYRDSEGLSAFVSPGVTRGHSAVPAAFSVAAAPAAEGIGVIQPGDPEGPTGPHPGVFTTASQVEPFTSDGPRRVFFAPDGSPAPQVRKKPDLTAADGTSTSVGGFERFYGTSAAAPHAAAIAALIVSGRPNITADALRHALVGTARDVDPRGWDSRAGAGIVRADLAIARTGSRPQALVRARAAVVVGSSDGDTIAEPGEDVRVDIDVMNGGDGDALNTTIGVTDASDGVLVVPLETDLGTLAKGSTATVAVTVAIPSSWPLGVPVVLDLEARFRGALSPTTQQLQIETGQPAEPVEFAYDGPAVPIPDDDDTGVFVTIPVTGIGPVSGVTFTVGGTVCSTDIGSTTVGIDHTWVSDLTIGLTAPAGQSVVVMTRSGGSGNNLCQVVFDDSAALPFGGTISDDAPYTGTWTPEEPLGSLVGQSGDGEWVVSVVDSIAGDVGAVRDVSIQVAGYE